MTAPDDRDGACAACGGEALAVHLRVRGELGDDGLVPTTKDFGTALGDIVRCERCGHMQLDRMPSAQELDEAYAVAESGDYVGEEAGQRASFATVLEKVERHVPGKGAILDVGCWVGFLLAEAEARGWAEVTGVEPSTFASGYARDRLGLDVRTEELFTADLPLAHYDVVVLADVLEHLTRPNAALDRVTELLRPGGLLCLAIPDSGSRVAKVLGKRWWSVIPTHVHYFTRGSAERILAAHGFRTLEITTDPKVFTIGYYLDKGSGYLPRVSKALVAAARKVKLADRMWGPDFRDRVVVLARYEG